MKYNIYLVGCGATGSNLILSLAQYAISENKINEIVLIDGDTVEEKNYRNQKFTKRDLAKNKAEVLSSRYIKLGINISFIDKYIGNEFNRLSEKDLIDLLQSFNKNSKYRRNVIVSCVDNNNARIILDNVFRDESIKDLIYIDTGNGTGRERFGQTVIGAKCDGIITASPISDYFPQLLEGDPEVVETVSCSAILKEEPQSLAVNVLSANVVFLTLVNLIETDTLNGKFYKFNANDISVNLIQ